MAPLKKHQNKPNGNLSQSDSLILRRESGDESNHIPNEGQFLRNYSKALGEALRAREDDEALERDQHRQRFQSGGSRIGIGDNEKQWERINVTYRELCHDDPVVSGGYGDCSLLAQNLVPKQSGGGLNEVSTMKNSKKLALCTRLVDGVAQAISRGDSVAKTTSPLSANSGFSDGTSNGESQNQPYEGNLTGQPRLNVIEGFAELMFSISVEGPYRCIQQAENLQVASSFLGSYQPPDNSFESKRMADDDNSRLAEEATSSIISGFETMTTVETNKKSHSKSPERNLENKVESDGIDDASSSSSEFFLHSANDAQKEFDNDSMKEIFADESDPDDYEYESSYDPYSASTDMQTIFGKSNPNADYDDSHDYGFEPVELSKPISTNQTWSGARKAIHHLLSNSSYGKLAIGSISNRTWSDRGMSDTLADLAFMLLLHNAYSSSHEGVAESNKETLLPCDKDNDASNAEINKYDISALWDRPLFLLRDRAMDVSSGHDALPSYLQLLRAFLLHSEEDIFSIMSSPKATFDSLPPATAVGLSCLASVCSSKEMISVSAVKMCGSSVFSVCPREEVRNTVLSSLDTLARIVACVRPRTLNLVKDRDSTEKEGPVPTWIRTAICLIPMTEYLTNLRSRFDFQPVFEGGAGRACGLSDTDAKLILDSGLLREMISLYSATRNLTFKAASSDLDLSSENRNTKHQNSIGAQSTVEDVARLQLLSSIFGLSIQSPEIIGSFAIRVPDLAKEVGSAEFMEKNLVDGILWTSLGSYLLESKSDLPTSRLKIRPNLKCKLKDPETTLRFSERSISGFEIMCNSSKEALELLKNDFHITRDNLSDEEKFKISNCKRVLGDVARFSNCLSSCRHATQVWLCSLNNKQDGIQLAKKKIEDIRSTLGSLPSFSEEIGVRSRGPKKDDDICEVSCDADDESREKQSLRRKQKEYGAVVASARASVKKVALALESQTMDVLKRAMVFSDSSSKTD